jgi:hypothetical protein
MILLTLFAIAVLNAQPEQTKAGKLMFKTSTSIVNVESNHNTNLYYLNSNGFKSWNVGFDFAYFDKNKLAIVTGIGYGKTNDLNVFSIKLGAKYYLLNRIPLQFDFLTSFYENLDDEPLYLGLQTGYAIFIKDFFSIEPTIRYNIPFFDYNRFNNYLTLQIEFNLFI